MKNKKKPSIAVGIDNDKELNEKATQEERRKGNYTNVTMLVNDEVDETE